MTEEGIEVLIGAWSQDNFTYNGQHYQYKNITLTPKPVQTEPGSMPRIRTD